MMIMSYDILSYFCFGITYWCQPIFCKMLHFENVNGITFIRYHKGVKQGVIGIFQLK
jgi:hypothetical protein